MTNEVEVAEKVTGAFGAQLNEGREVASQVMTWVTEKGLDFAVNLLAAALILVVGWLVIKRKRKSPGISARRARRSAKSQSER